MVIDKILQFFNRIADKWLLTGLFVFLIISSSGGDFYEKAAFIVLGCLVNIMQQRRGNVGRPTSIYGKDFTKSGTQCDAETRVGRVSK